MVFPKPTSSASNAPFESGELKAKSAASTWCGFKSTCALATAPASFSILSDEQRLVSPDFSPVKKNKAALYGIRAVSPNSYAKGEARPYGNTVYNRTNGISATGASWSGGKI